MIVAEEGGVVGAAVDQIIFNPALFLSRVSVILPVRVDRRDHVVVGAEGVTVDHVVGVDLEAEVADRAEWHRQ